MSGFSEYPLIMLPATAGASSRAAAATRHLIWAVVGSNVVHATLIVVASMTPLGWLSWLSSAVPFDLPPGDNMVRISAAFVEASPESAEEIPIEHAPESRPAELTASAAKVIPPSGVPTAASSNVEPVAVSPEFAAAPSPLVSEERDRPSSSDELPNLQDADQATPPQLQKHQQQPPSTPSQATASVSAPSVTGNAPDALPTSLINPSPAYPPELLARRIEAAVLLRIHISAEGRVIAVTVERSSGYASMDESALLAVKGWKFKPAMREGKAVEMKVLKRVRFDIEE